MKRLSSHVRPVTLVVFLAASSCGDGTDQLSAEGSDDQAGVVLAVDGDVSQTDALFSFLRGRHGIALFDVPYRSLAEALPNVTFRHPDGTSRSASDLLVVGDVRSVRPGVGLGLTSEGDKPVSFDDPSASLVSAVLTVNVTEAFDAGGRADVGATVDVEITFGPAAAREPLLEGAAAMGRVALLLSRGALFDAPDVYSVLEGAGTILVVAEDGELSLPAYSGPDLAERFLGEVTTLSDLTDQASKSPGPALVAPSFGE